MLYIIVTLDDLAYNHRSHKAHCVAKSIDDAHESASKVVGNVQHGALLPGVDEAIAAHSQS